MLDEISKIREYLDYLEEHYCNVQGAWADLQTRCMSVMDDLAVEAGIPMEDLIGSISIQVLKHDYSKLHDIEFNSYRRYFFPTNKERMLEIDNKAEATYAKASFDEAWKHHKGTNKHHYENWAVTAPLAYEKDAIVSCIHMVCDWLAMSKQKGGTALEFYTNNKAEITIPDWADKFVMSLLERFYDEF